MVQFVVNFNVIQIMVNVMEISIKINDKTSKNKRAKQARKIIVS